MPNSVSGHSIEQVQSTIKKIEMNPQCDMPGPAINNLPAERGRSPHLEGMGMGKGKMKE